MNAVPMECRNTFQHPDPQRTGALNRVSDWLSRVTARRRQRHRPLSALDRRDDELLPERERRLVAQPERPTSSLVAYRRNPGFEVPAIPLGCP
jgi:hypothetical protein